MDGISVALTTWNNLSYLKKAIYSLNKYSILPETELVIFVDGSTDGTFEWLENEGIPHIGRRENIGCYSGWNRAIEHCNNKYVLQGEDDLFFGPEWDKYLLAWFKKLGDRYVIMPQLIEPIIGSYAEPCDCGRTVETFDEEKFVKEVERIRESKILAVPTGLLTMTKELWLSVGGFDEFYDPCTRGDIDLLLRLSRKYPDLRWIRVCDSISYHFPPKLYDLDGDKNRYEIQPVGGYKWEDLRKKNLEYFDKRFGLNVPDSYDSIPCGLRK